MFYNRTCHSRLEAGIVIYRHFIGLKVVSFVLVVIIRSRATHKSAYKHVRIWSISVEVTPITNGVGVARTVTNIETFYRVGEGDFFCLFSAAPSKLSYLVDATITVTGLQI
jgi:hypothetical protein